MAPVFAKSLSRLSRDALIDLCLEWTGSKHSTPYLTSNRNLLETEEEDYLHEPAEDRSRLRKAYEEIRQHNSKSDPEYLSKRDIIDRIVDGDWRRGLSLHQLATIDFACLEEIDTAFRWSALKLVPLKSNTNTSSHPSKRRKLAHPPARQPDYPQLEATCFAESLKRHIQPLVKAHYTMRRLRSCGLTILRLYIVPVSAFAPSKSAIPKSPKQATDAARVMLIALPDSCPYVYISLSGSTTSKTLTETKVPTKAKIDINATKRIILEAIPKAFSRPQERWSLESTKLNTRSLRSMCLLRGSGRPGTAGGAYAKFSDDYSGSTATETDVQSQDAISKSELVHARPSQIQCPTPPPEEVSQLEIEVTRRFGKATGSSHAPLNRVHVKIENILSPAPYTLGKDKRKADATRSKSDPSRKRKRLSLEEIERGDFRGRQQPSVSEERDESLQQSASVTIAFSGTDVIAGLRKLALLGGNHVDLDRMPAWVTGEKGVTGLTV